MIRDPPQVPAVRLQTQSGAHTDLAAFRGKWLLVDFIYTRCVTYCLILGGEFAQLQHKLAAPIAAGKVQLLSISFDPAHDTPDRLRIYLQDFGSHGPSWVAARPVDAAGLARLKKAFGLTVIRGPLGFVHNAAIHIVDPAGRLVRILDMGHPERVAQTVRQELGQ